MFFALVGFTACQANNIDYTQNYTQGAYPLPAKAIGVTVLYEDDLSGVYDVDDAGMILMPLAGRISVAGRSSQNIEAEIAQRLADGYILDPQVSVRKIMDNSVYIMGAVHAPGRYELPQNASTILNIVAMAGGFTEDADQETAELVHAGHDDIPPHHEKGVALLNNVGAGDTIIIREGRSFYR